MKHYVVVYEWAFNYENGITIFGVTHSVNDAKRIFNNHIADTRRSAEESGYEIYEDCDVLFDSGEDGIYCVNHEKLFIKMVE